MKFTMFKSVFDTEKIDSDKPWPAIVERAQRPREYPRKDAMPLFKCAIFGDVRSTGGFLRHERNMRAVTGVEAEHDAGTVTAEDVVTKLGMNSITALVYTTPSHTPDAPRWRIFAPLSREYPVEDRARFVARLNGVVDGVLADESFTAAQSFYWGRVADVPYMANESRGEFVDLLPALDERATYPRGREAGMAAASTVTDSDLRHVVLEGIPGEVYRALVALSARLIGRGMSASDALAVLHSLLDDCEWRERDPATWEERRNGCEGLVHSAAARFTDRRERAAPRLVAVNSRPAATIEPASPERGVIVQTGILIPRSVTSAQEVRIESLRDVLGERNGAYPNSLANAAAIVQVSLNGKLWLDESTGHPMNGPKVLTEVDAYKVTAMVGNISGGQNFRANVVQQAMVMLAHRNPIDPWRDWLNDLEWDGTERLNSIAEDYFGVAVGDGELERLIFRKLMLASVARQFSPGCKFDSMVVLEGPQGVGKSRALRALFGEPYVAGWEHDFNSKDFRQQLQGNVCIEVAELASFQRSEMKAIKSIVSETVDVYRPSYGHNVVRRPRRCVLIGTSNEDSYLTDTTGNRRFWPIKCGHINVEGLAENREQLFAEAVAAFRAGGADGRLWELPSRIVDEQEARVVEDPWYEALRAHLVGRVKVRVVELMGDPLRVPVERQTSGAARRVVGILKQLDYIGKREANGGARYWEKDPEAAACGTQPASGT